MKYYIKTRYNPQLDKPYYVALGKLKASEAKKMENSLYGHNVVEGYKKDEYLAKCEELGIEPII